MCKSGPSVTLRITGKGPLAHFSGRLRECHPPKNENGCELDPVLEPFGKFGGEKGAKDATSCSMALFSANWPRVPTTTPRHCPWADAPRHRCAQARSVSMATSEPRDLLWGVARSSGQSPYTRPGHVAHAFPWERCDPTRNDVAGNPSQDRRGHTTFSQFTHLATGFHVSK